MPNFIWMELLLNLNMFSLVYEAYYQHPPSCMNLHYIHGRYTVTFEVTSQVFPFKASFRLRKSNYLCPQYDVQWQVYKIFRQIIINLRHHDQRI